MLYQTTSTQKCTSFSRHWSSVVSFHQVYNTLVLFLAFCNNFLWFNMFLGCNVLNNRAFRFVHGFLACTTSEFTRHHSKMSSFQSFEIILSIINYKKLWPLSTLGSVIAQVLVGPSKQLKQRIPTGRRQTSWLSQALTSGSALARTFRFFFSWICLHFAFS